MPPPDGNYYGKVNIFAILRRQALGAIDSLRQPLESVAATIERLKWWLARGNPLHTAA